MLEIISPPEHVQKIVKTGAPSRQCGRESKANSLHSKRHNKRIDPKKPAAVRFENTHGPAVLEVRKAVVDPNWHPSWMQRVALQNRVRGILLEKISPASKQGIRSDEDDDTLSLNKGILTVDFTLRMGHAPCSEIGAALITL
jgi:hypothetical protein